MMIGSVTCVPAMINRTVGPAVIDTEEEEVRERV